MDFKENYNDFDDTSDLLQHLDIDNPQNNVIPESATMFELLSLQSEISSKTFSEALLLLQNLSTESSQEQRDRVKDLAERNNLVSQQHLMQMQHHPLNISSISLRCHSPTVHWFVLC